MACTKMVHFLPHPYLSESFVCVTGLILGLDDNQTHLPMNGIPFVLNSVYTAVILDL